MTDPSRIRLRRVDEIFVGDQGSPSVLDILPETQQRVRALRSGRDMDQQDLAREVTATRNRLVPPAQRRDVSYRIIQRIEEGDYAPLREPAMQLALSSALGVTPDLLFPDQEVTLQQWRDVESNLRAVAKAMDGTTAGRKRTPDGNMALLLMVQDAIKEYDGPRAIPLSDIYIHDGEVRFFTGDRIRVAFSLTWDDDIKD